MNVINLPSPAHGLGEKATQRSTGSSSGAKNDVHVPLPDATIPQRDDIRQQDGDNGVHATATDAGNSSRDDQLPYVASKTTTETAEGEDDIGKEKTLLAAKDVTQFAIQRLGTSEGQKVTVDITKASVM